jgi:hypothetical protein
MDIQAIPREERDRMMEAYLWDKNPESRITHDPRDAIDFPVSSDWEAYYQSRGLMHGTPPAIGVFPDRLRAAMRPVPPQVTNLRQFVLPLREKDKKPAASKGSKDSQPIKGVEF